jgi:antitoxin (DNA-binding transcriptional repressor) of toxin-antitoxin stability system
LDLRQVKSIGIQKARSALSEVLKEVEAGIHFLILRFDQPVAALIRHQDYVHFSNLARRDALARALLRGKGYDPDSLSEDEFLDLLASHIKEGSDASR